MTPALLTSKLSFETPSVLGVGLLIRLVWAGQGFCNIAASMLEMRFGEKDSIIIQGLDPSRLQGMLGVFNRYCFNSKNSQLDWAEWTLA